MTMPTKSPDRVWVTMLPDPGGWRCANDTPSAFDVNDAGVEAYVRADLHNEAVARAERAQARAVKLEAARQAATDLFVAMAASGAATGTGEESPVLIEDALCKLAQAVAAVVAHEKEQANG